MRSLILVRHGETLGESSIRYHGHNDVKLSPAGREHMRRVALDLDLSTIRHVVASPLSRARESAEILAPGREIALEDDLREVHFGRWEGLTAAEIEARDPELYARWRQSEANFGYPDGECRSDFRARVAQGIERWLPGEEESVLAVLHKGVIRVVVAHLLGFPLEDAEPALGGVLRIERRGQAPWQLVPYQRD